jgi:hypothetical protein
MNICFTRVLRTSSSERYLLHIDGVKDDAALDLHYLSDNSVAGTLIVLNDKFAKEKKVAEIVEAIDKILLPNVSLEEGNLSFTVVQGTVIGSFIGESVGH